MVGLGEGKCEVLQVMDDLRSADVDFLTIGQYLQPTPKHHVVDRFVTPEEFKQYEAMAYNKGFLMVSASPLTRSSRSEEHTSELQSLMRISYAVFCLTKNKNTTSTQPTSKPRQTNT